jgi:hypothetical protein
MKLLYNGIVFEYYTVTLKYEDWSLVRGVHTVTHQEIVRIRKPLWFARTNREHRNLVRLQALQQAKRHSELPFTVTDWE